MTMKIQRLSGTTVLTLVLTLLAPAAARAQWTTNASTATTTTTDTVGVGTVSPANSLTVQKDQPYNSAAGVSSMTQVQVKNDSASGFASFSVWSTGERGRLQYNAGVPNIFLTTRGSIPLYLGTNDSIRMAVDGSTGNVGIGLGTAAPANILHVGSTSGGGFIRVSGAGLGAVNFQDTGAPQDQKLYQWRSEGGLFRMSLANDGNTALVRQDILVANSSGNVGIGTASPASALHVSAPTRTALTMSDSSAPKLRLMRTIGSQSDFAHNVSYDGTGWTLDDTSSGGASLSVSNNFVAFNQWSAGAGYRATSTPFFIDSSGRVGIGTTSPGSNSPADPQLKLDVQGSVNVSGNINAKYQDVAEWVPSTQKLAAGTVVVLDPEKTNHVIASTSAYDTKVAGVVSERPGISLGERGEGKALVATTGRVKVRVDATRAPIKVGDLLVTSDTEGVAMKSEPVEISGRKLHTPGTIIGKALEPLEKGTGEILVLLSLQ